MASQSLAYQISLTLGDHAGDYDIPAIESDVRGLGVTTDIDEVESAAYWEIVKRHDRTGEQNTTS